jgi:hypothetical protein
VASPTNNLNDLSHEQLVALLSDVLARLIAPTPATSIALLSPEDLAKRWGVPESWVREQWRAERLHGQRLGRYVRHTEADAAEFLASDHAKGITAPVRLIHSGKRAIHHG